MPNYFFLPQVKNKPYHRGKYAYLKYQAVADSYNPDK